MKDHTKNNLKTYPSRLNLDISKDGDCPAGTLLIKTSTLLAEVIMQNKQIQGFLKK